MVAESYIWHVCHDALQREAHRKIAGIDDLFGTSGIGVVDDGFRIVLGGES